MSTYVLVHGGSHGGWCYQRVARILRSKGHEVYCPTMTGLGERSHLLDSSVNLGTHITDVVNVLLYEDLYEDLYDVVLAGHSYGGSGPIGYYGVTDPSDIAWMTDKLTPHPWKSFEQPLTLVNERAVREIPRTIINCTSTIAMAAKAQMGRSFDADRVWEIDTGHDLMITEAAKLAQMLESLSLR